MAKSDKRFLTGMGTAIALVVLFAVLLTNPGDELNYDTFVIVREHTIGSDPSADSFYAYNYGVTFRIFGATHTAKVSNTYSHSSEESKAKLLAALQDTADEITIIEMVDRDDLL